MASFQSFSTPCCNHPSLLSACYPLSFFPPTSPTSAPEKRCQRDHRASDASRILMVHRRRGMGVDRQNVEGGVGWVVTVSYSSLDLYQKISFVDLYLLCLLIRFYIIWIHNIKHQIISCIYIINVIMCNIIVDQYVGNIIITIMMSSSFKKKHHTSCGNKMTFRTWNHQVWDCAWTQLGWLFQKRRGKVGTGNRGVVSKK